MNQPLRIGTRGSRLALAQATWLQREIARRFPGTESTLVRITTSGDRFVDRPLRDVGGKGLFVKEIEQALLDGAIDCAIHSMKDVPSALAADLMIAAVPPREDPRDVLISRERVPLAELPPGSRLGTSSTRRQALCRALRRDLVVDDLRGNVDTRLRRLDEGDFAAILLAAAGLRRLGIEPDGAQPLSVEEFVPAIGQGALAIETRPDAIGNLFAQLDDRATRACITAEREVLAALGGSCHTPIAAHGSIDDAGMLTVNGLVARPDGTQIVRACVAGSANDAASLGRTLAHELRRGGADAILAALET